MYSVQIKGFHTKAEAEAFINWYSSGEQDAEPWFEARQEEGIIECTFMGIDSQATYPLTWTDNKVQCTINPFYGEEQ